MLFLPVLGAPAPTGRLSFSGDFAWGDLLRCVNPGHGIEAAIDCYSVVEHRYIALLLALMWGDFFEQAQPVVEHRYIALFLALRGIFECRRWSFESLGMRGDDVSTCE